jgi:hypothetical protein
VVGFGFGSLKLVWVFFLVFVYEGDEVLRWRGGVIGASCFVQYSPTVLVWWWLRI